MTLERIGVIGAGQMGAGIAQVAAQAGLNTIVTDVSDERLEVGRKAVESSLNRLVSKQKLTAEEMSAALERLTWSTRVEDHGDRHIVIEAVP